jgi:sigma-E factor negative regulatory protein RseB
MIASRLFVKSLLITGFLLNFSYAGNILANESPREELSPQSLLLKMAEASRELDYQGTFTYQHKDNPSLQNFRITHYVENNIAVERLQYLNGPEREIVRKSPVDSCALTEKNERPNSFAHLGERLSHVTEYYRFEIRGIERVAGRLATVLMAIPVDGYRYSYYFSVDNESGLVLKSWLVDEAARPLERYQFVELTINPNLEKIKKLPVAKLHKNAGIPCMAEQQPLKKAWKPAWIPPGFGYLGYKIVQDDIDMLMYSDGLSSFSIFVEQASSPIPEGVAQRGATLAAMDNISIEGKIYRVTVVGEIPIVSAQKIAQQIVANSEQQVEQ